ncbi:Glycoprotein G [Gossypium arboreum]|uniref:Glycoprotein G n=1 Tax=Gossypium arboreum TaxID=29729 RepID=A0A0B0NMD5_GOSAR|nr:Glycoprotein G [Gossypium arboreum]
MGWGSKAGDWVFKGLTAGLGLATIYLTATFSVNVYRGLAWHNSQSGRQGRCCLEGVTWRKLRSRAPMNNPLDISFLAGKPSLRFVGIVLLTPRNLAKTYLIC